MAQLTPRQEQAQDVIASTATHAMLFGGSRSGKTFLLVRNVVTRALKAAGSRHAILRFRFNHVKASVIHDTFPKVMDICFASVSYDINKTDWYAEFPNGSQIWFGGLDDKERTEKILGQEYVTIYLNECSQIPQGSRDIAVTRLAQKVDQVFNGRTTPMRPRMFYDCNPPSKAHWSYRLFVEKRDPETKVNLINPSDYTAFQINPESNAANLPSNYLDQLRNQSQRLQRRFLRGEFADATPNALWNDADIDKFRHDERLPLPEFLRVVVAVDPSGASDDNPENDAIGIVVTALGVDGNGYVLEDLTLHAGPSVWARVAVDAYDRHQADVIVAEVNYGGAMVQHTIQTAKRGVPFKMLTAARGKHVRADPIAALADVGKIRHVGVFTELEDELCAFSTSGYLGDRSPNRADAMIWGMSELFPGLVAPRDKKRLTPILSGNLARPHGSSNWMGK